MDNNIRITLLSNEEENFVEGIDIDGKLYPRGLDKNKHRKVKHAVIGRDMLFEKEELQDYIARVENTTGINIRSILEKRTYEVEKLSEYLDNHLEDPEEIAHKMIMSLQYGGDPSRIDFYSPEELICFDDLGEKILPQDTFDSIRYFEITSNSDIEKKGFIDYRQYAAVIELAAPSKYKSYRHTVDSDSATEVASYKKI